MSIQFACFLISRPPFTAVVASAASIPAEPRWQRHDLHAAVVEPFEVEILPDPAPENAEPAVVPSQMPPQPVGSAPATDLPDNTVRVAVRQLDLLNDLFGELIIERNGLDLHLKRLRNLVVRLSQRVKILEESNAQLCQDAGLAWMWCESV